MQYGKSSITENDIVQSYNWTINDTLIVDIVELLTFRAFSVLMMV